MARTTYTARDVISFIKRASSLVFFSFWAGMLFHIGFTMAVQDYVGKQAWLERVDAAWVYMSPLWGIALAGAAFGLYVWASGQLRKWEAALELIDLEARTQSARERSNHVAWGSHPTLSAKLYRLADWFDAMDANGTFGGNPGDAVQSDIRKAADILKRNHE